MELLGSKWAGGSSAVRTNLRLGYVAEKTPVPFYTNTHGRLESMRDHARIELFRAKKEEPQWRRGGGEISHSGGADILLRKGWGPRVVVCGGADNGKSSLCKILTR